MRFCFQDEPKVQSADWRLFFLCESFNWIALPRWSSWILMYIFIIVLLISGWFFRFEIITTYLYVAIPSTKQIWAKITATSSICFTTHASRLVSRRLNYVSAEENATQKWKFQLKRLDWIYRYIYLSNAIELPTKALGQ